MKLKKGARLNFTKGKINKPIGYKVELNGKKGIGYKDNEGKITGFKERDELIRDLFMGEYEVIDDIDL